MSTGSSALARILLKARPTPAQLADRFAEPWPDGLELYLDRADVVDEQECAAVLQRIRDYDLPKDFAFVVEGRYLYTPIGMAPEDVAWFIERVPGLMATLDVSHAQLYVNARAMADSDDQGDAPEPLMQHLRNFPRIDSVEGFIDVLGSSIFE